MSLKSRITAVFDHEIYYLNDSSEYTIANRVSRLKDLVLAMVDDSDEPSVLNLENKSEIGVHCPSDPTLIIVDSDGPENSNQTGGVSCDQDSVRGYAYDLAKYITSQDDLNDLSPCMCGYSNNGASQIQRVLDKYNLPIKVDGDWQREAWVRVKVTYKGQVLDGILTYNNCD